MTTSDSTIDLLRRIAELERRLDRLAALDRLNYETGTFTPTYFGSATAGVTTYTTQLGSYRQVGNMVFLWLRVAWSNATGTGNGRVGGLPVAVTSNTPNTTLSIMSSNYPFTSAGLAAYLLGTFSSDIVLYDITTGGFAQAAIDVAADLIISGVYFV